MNPEEWRAAGTMTTILDHEIFFREGGSGPPLLLIHGFPTSSWDWHCMWDELTAHYRVIAPDMLGFGFSDKPRGHAYSLFEQTDLVEQLLRSREISAVHVLSHDYGDTVAQELLARHERSEQMIRVESVCMLNGGVIPGQHRPRFMQKLLAGPLGFLVSPFLGESRFHKSFAEVFGPDTQPTADESHDFWSCIAHNDGARVMYLLSRYQQERRHNYDRWVNALRDTDVPFHGIFGARDPVSGDHMADVLAALRTGEELTRLPHVGHYPQTEDPGAVLEAYARFRASLPTRA